MMPRRPERVPSRWATDSSFVLSVLFFGSHAPSDSYAHRADTLLPPYDFGHYNTELYISDSTCRTTSSA
jgi:hypothetical protein